MLAACSGFFPLLISLFVFISVDFVAVIDSGLGHIKKSTMVKRERSKETTSICKIVLYVI